MGKGGATAALELSADEKKLPAWVSRAFDHGRRRSGCVASSTMIVAAPNQAPRQKLPPCMWHMYVRSPPMTARRCSRKPRSSRYSAKVVGIPAMRLPRAPRALARFSGVAAMTSVGRKKLKPSHVALEPSCRLLAPAISSPSA